MFHFRNRRAQKRISAVIIIVIVAAMLAGSLAYMGVSANAQAKMTDTIAQGVYAGAVPLGGLNRTQAAAAIDDYVEGLKASTVTLKINEEHSVEMPAADLNIQWTNRGLVDEAVNIGKMGNVIVRYKDVKDLENRGKIYELRLSVDRQAINNVIEEKCTAFDVQAVEARLDRAEGGFAIAGGQSGVKLNVEASEEKVYDYLTTAWTGGDTTVDLVVETDAPKADSDTLSMVRDVLGSYTTDFSTSSSDRSTNVTNGCRLINGTTLYPGESFSTYNTVKPFSEANGYRLAGSYMNGQVVDSFGGGICQVSTTLYNAVLKAELEVTERHNHSMIVSYVKPSMDAAIAESSGKDFKFTNNTDYPIYIEGYCRDKSITFNIYGVETRSSDHKVSYESETLETIQPGPDAFITTSSEGVGFVKGQSAHIGYKARLWKIVTEGGKEVSREQINSSYYKPAPRTFTVGINGASAAGVSAINEAIATGSLDAVKAAANAAKNGTTPQDSALSGLLNGKSAEEQEAIKRQYEEQLAEQQRQAQQAQQNAQEEAAAQEQEMQQAVEQAEANDDI